MGVHAIQKKKKVGDGAVTDLPITGRASPGTYYSTSVGREASGFSGEPGLPV